MKAFHNDPAIKEKYLSRVRHHREMDELIQGTGWENGKGCAVGCTLEAYDHARYEAELGIPEWLARVEDILFEGLSKEKAMLWPERFLQAIPIGADLDKIKGSFLIFILQSTLNTFDHEKYPDVKKCIDDVIGLWRLPEEERIKNAEAYAAVEAAYAAVEEAYAAVEAAYAAAYATRAAAEEAYTARAVKAATRAAAEEAYTAYTARAVKASRAARAAAYESFANELIRLIEGKEVEL